MRMIFRHVAIAFAIVTISGRCADAQVVPPPDASASPQHVPSSPPVLPAAGPSPESSPPAAESVATATIEGTVVESSTGIGLSDVGVIILGPNRQRVVTDASGKFKFASVKPGIVRLEIRKSGYQTADTEDITVIGTSAATVTLQLVRAEAAKDLKTIGRSSVRAAQSLQKASVVYKASTAAAIEQQGYYRTGDYLRTLPSVSGDGGTETAGAGDDLYLDVRGIGALETVTLYDGHPIGYGHKRGVNLGYNFDLSPTFALRDVQLTYGSGGSDLLGISAIGGIIDMHTIDTTRDPHAAVSQAYGTWANLSSSIVTTGPITNRLQFAFAGGVNSREGYFRHDTFRQPSAVQDPSAPVGTLGYNSGVYQTDATYVNRGGLVKFRYQFGKPERLSSVTVHGLFQKSWTDRTGNSDIDYQPYVTELAKGDVALAQYNAAPGGTCPKGQFAVSARDGSPAYVPCQTPQQFARFNQGFAGAGPAWSQFVVQDYGLKAETPFGKTNLTLDAFTNNYAQTYDRTFQLPYNAKPGDNPNWENPRVTATGETIGDELPGKNNDVGVGFAAFNYAYLYPNGDASGLHILNSPVVHESATLFHDTYHPQGGKYTLFLNAGLKNSTITHTWNFDPRFAVVYSLTPRDVVRLAAGKTTSQPYAVFVATPFSPAGTGSLQGTVNCGLVNSIGSGGNPKLTPETGADEEFSFGHRFRGDTQVQLTAYNTNINNKIFQTVVPLSAFPASYVAGIDLASYTNVFRQNGCTGDPLKGLGVGVQDNVGHMIARGLDLSGRARFTRHLYVDYDYSTESVFVRSLPDATLRNNLTIVPNAQLPTVPVHKYQIAADYSFPGGVDLRLTRYYVGVNNAKNSPAYTYSDLTANSPVGKRGTINLAVNNAFNQNADIRGQFGLGVPLPLNKFATDLTPLIGQSATELYALPYRTFTMTYSYRI